MVAHKGKVPLVSFKIGSISRGSIAYEIVQYCTVLYCSVQFVADVSIRGGMTEDTILYLWVWVLFVRITQS
jgi:hypothetical protein